MNKNKKSDIDSQVDEILAKTPDLKFGEKDVLGPDEFKSKHMKQRVSMLLYADTIDVFKTLAKETDIKYQTLMRSALRDAAEAILNKRRN